MIRSAIPLGFAFVVALSAAAVQAQESTYINPRGDVVTDTRSLQDGQYINDRTTTTPGGKTFTNDRTSGPNSTGSVTSQDVRTDPNGRTVTDTRTNQNGQYTNDRTTTTAHGKTYSNDRTMSLKPNGHVQTQNTWTGPNGKSRTVDTTHGFYRNRTTVVGRNGNSRSFSWRR